MTHPGWVVERPVDAGARQLVGDGVCGFGGAQLLLMFMIFIVYSVALIWFLWLASFCRFGGCLVWGCTGDGLGIGLVYI